MGLNFEPIPITFSIMPTPARPNPTDWLYVAKSYNAPNSRSASKGNPKNCFAVQLHPYSKHPPEIWLHVDIVRNAMEPAWNRKSDLLQAFQDVRHKLIVPGSLVAKMFLELEIFIAPELDKEEKSKGELE